MHYLFNKLLLCVAIALVMTLDLSAQSCIRCPDVVQSRPVFPDLSYIRWNNTPNSCCAQMNIQSYTLESGGLVVNVSNPNCFGGGTQLTVTGGPDNPPSGFPINNNYTGDVVIPDIGLRCHYVNNVNTGSTPLPPPAPIPSVSQWGLIILGGLFLLFGGVMVRRML